MHLQIEVVNQLNDAKPASIKFQESLFEGGVMVFQQLEGFQHFNGDEMVPAVGCRKTGQKGTAGPYPHPNPKGDMP